MINSFADVLSSLLAGLKQGLEVSLLEKLE